MTGSSFHCLPTRSRRCSLGREFSRPLRSSTAAASIEREGSPFRTRAGPLCWFSLSESETPGPGPGAGWAAATRVAEPLLGRTAAGLDSRSHCHADNCDLSSSSQSTSSFSLAKLLGSGRLGLSSSVCTAESTARTARSSWRLSQCPQTGCLLSYPVAPSRRFPSPHLSPISHTRRVCVKTLPRVAATHRSARPARAPANRMRGAGRLAGRPTERPCEFSRSAGRPAVRVPEILRPRRGKRAKGDSGRRARRARSRQSWGPHDRHKTTTSPALNLVTPGPAHRAKGLVQVTVGAGSQ